MERKTVKIKLFSDNPKRCLVNGESYKTGVAKIHFGDWDNLDDYKEKQRRRFRGISHYDFDVETEIVAEAEVVKKTSTGEMFMEDEFPNLGDEEKLEIENQERETADEDEIVEEQGKQCEAITKSGNQCKNEALDNSDFCQVHQPKETK